MRSEKRCKKTGKNAKHAKCSAKHCGCWYIEMHRTWYRWNKYVQYSNLRLTSAKEQIKSELFLIFKSHGEFHWYLRQVTLNRYHSTSHSENDPY